MLHKVFVIIFVSILYQLPYNLVGNVLNQSHDITCFYMDLFQYRGSSFDFDKARQVNIHNHVKFISIKLSFRLHT